MPIARTLNQDFFKTWSSEMAYVLGYFAADGCMVLGKRGGKYIEFTSCDRELLEMVKTVTHANQQISTRPQRSENWRVQYRLQVGSKVWFADLTGLGFSQSKSHTLMFPEIPSPFFGDFVRGYFDGGGCVYFKRHWSKWHKKEIWVFMSLFTSGSRHFLEVLHTHLRLEGIIGGHIAMKKRGYALVFSRHDSLALYRLMYHTAQATDLLLSRKKEKLEKAIQVLKLEK